MDQVEQVLKGWQASLQQRLCKFASQRHTFVGIEQAPPRTMPCDRTDHQQPTLGRTREGGISQCPSFDVKAGNGSISASPSLDGLKPVKAAISPCSSYDPLTSRDQLPQL